MRDKGIGYGGCSHFDKEIDVKLGTKDKRTVIKLGESLAVVLPSNFCRYIGLQKGDEVEVCTKGNLVQITPYKEGA